MFNQILDLIGQPPGSLVYHFIVIFAVQAALAISFGQWMRERDPSTKRLTVAVAGIFLARALLLIAALLVWQGFAPRDILLPPVERAVDMLTLLGLFWAFVTMDDPEFLRRNFIPDLIATVMLGVIIAGFVGTYYYWSSSVQTGVLFNSLWLDLVWGAAGVILGITGLIWLITRIRYVRDPLLKGIILMLLSGMMAIHLINPALGDIAAAVRVGQIIAMPMLTAVVYRHTIEQLLHWDEFIPTPTSELPRVTLPAVTAEQPSPAQPIVQPPVKVSAETPPPETLPDLERPQIPGESDEVEEEVKDEDPINIIEIVEALGGLHDSLEQDRVANNASRSVAIALRADICVLIVIDEATQEGGIIGGYDNIAQTPLPQAILNLSEHPTIVNALGRLRQMRLTPQRNRRELRDLYRSLLISHEGPAYIQPLVDGGERIGVLIVGTPYSGRLLIEDERNLLDRLGPIVSAAMLNAETYRVTKLETETIALEEGVRLATLSDDLMASRTELNTGRSQIKEMGAYIRDLTRQLESAQAVSPDSLNDYEDIKQRFAYLATEHEALRQSNEELEQRGAEKERLLQEAIENKQDAGRIARLEEEVAHLRQEAVAKENQDQQMPPFPVSPSQLPQQIIDENLINTHTEIASLRTRLVQASISQQEVAFLQEQLSAKAGEAISLRSRLIEAEGVIGALREQVESKAGSALDVMQNRITAQITEIQDLHSRLEATQSQMAIQPDTIQEQEQQEREADAEFGKKITERTAKIISLEEQLSEKNRAINELKGYMSDIEGSLRNLEQHLSSKTDEVTTLQASLTKASEQAAQRLTELEQQSTTEDTSITLNTAHIESLQNQLANRSEAVGILEDQLEETQAIMRELEQQLNATSQAVDEAISKANQTDTQDEVIAAMAQELRTPMSSIMGYTDLLLRESVGILGALQRKFLQRVKANTERMGVLLDDLIRLTAFDMGRFELRPQQIDVVYTIEEVISGVMNQYREKGLVLRMQIDKDIPDLHADRNAFLQVLSHLLTNAALVSPVDGEVQLLATTRVDTVPAFADGGEGECLYLIVEDSGEGVSPDDYTRVFDRQYRAENPLIEGLGDTGVSLAIAKTLIDAHGGRIWLSNEEGSGTTFYVLLPMVAPESLSEDSA